MKTQDNLENVLRMSEIWSRVDYDNINDIFPGKLQDDNHQLIASWKWIRTILLNLTRYQQHTHRSKSRKLEYVMTIVVVVVGLAWLISFILPNHGMKPTNVSPATGQSQTQATGGPTKNGTSQTSLSFILPIQLKDYLDFNIDHVISINIKRYNENWELDKSINVSNPSEIAKITDLLSHMELNIISDYNPKNIQISRYFIAFYMEDRIYKPYEERPFLNFNCSKDQTYFTVGGSFTKSMKLNPWDHFVQINESIDYVKVKNIIESIFDQR